MLSSAATISLAMVAVGVSGAAISITVVGFDFWRRFAGWFDPRTVTKTSLSHPRVLLTGPGLRVEASRAGMAM